MYKILIADSLPEEILSQYQNHEIFTVENHAGIDKEALMKALPEYDGLVVRSRTKVTPELLECAGKLKVIGRAGAGVDNIDTSEATRRGIIVMNTPGGNTIAAAEQTLALMLSALRNIPDAHASMKQERWDRKKYMGNELYEKTVGIVGLGKIGREVAKRLTAFGTKLIAYDPILTLDVADRMGLELVELDEVFRRSDIITIHAPKMAETLNMVNAERLALCRDGVIIVNCARGGLINEKDLIAALDSGKVATAAIDVYESEPPENWDLARHPRVVATPHLGASTREAQSKVAGQVLDQMGEYFQKGVARHAVNFISVEEKLLPRITPYFTLANLLGQLYSRIRSGRLQEVAIRFYGDIIDLPLPPICSHLMAGALRGGSDSSSQEVDLINMVNSLAIAREKGITVEISRKDQQLNSHTNLIACDFHSESGLVHLSGTLYAQDLFRLVEFDQYNVDANLAESMVIVENDDVPGIIGRVGTALAEEGINISQVSSGRDLAQKTATNIFNVEGKLSAGLAERLSAEAHIRRVLLIDREALK